MNMGLRAKVSESEFSAASVGEYLRIVKSEESAAVSNSRMMFTALQEEQRDLRIRLSDSEERHEDTVHEMREAQHRLRHFEDNARQNLPTMHEELNELRRMLKQQEEANSRMKSEYETSRHLPHQASVQTSSMPISSRTTENGWDLLNTDRVVAFPVGSEVRSPELLTPSHRSPVNRENQDGGVFATLIAKSEEAAQERFAPRAPLFSFKSEPSECFAPDAPASSSRAATVQAPIVRDTDARAVRDEQLRDLLGTLRMNRRSASSSTSVQGGGKDQDERVTDAMIAKIVEDDVRMADIARSDSHTGSKRVDDVSTTRGQSSSSRQDDRDVHIRNLELGFLAQIDEMQRELDKSKQTEQRLRADRDEWRLMAEDMQARKDEDEDEEEEYEDDDEDVDDRNPNPAPSSGGGGSPGKGPSKPRDDPPDPDGGDDDDGRDDPEITEVKISRREADKVVVPPFPTVTHLDNWMAQCIANVFSVRVRIPIRRNG